MLLRTPNARDGEPRGTQPPEKRLAGGHQPSLADQMEHLMPTPRAVNLLPTPAVNDMGAAYTPETWDAWTERMKAAHNNGNGHGASLNIEALRVMDLLPTPRAAQGETRNSAVYRRYYQGQEVTNNLENAVAFMVPGVQISGTPNERTQDARPAEVGSREELPGLWEATDAEAVRQRAAGRSNGVPQEAALLPELREQPTGGHPLRAPVAGEAASKADVRGVRDDQAPTRPPQGQELAERRPGEPSDTVRDLSPQAALAGGEGAACGCDQGGCRWGKYAAAIHHWERILGRPAPDPTNITDGYLKARAKRLARKDKRPVGMRGSLRPRRQLAARLSEFMMGVPLGWITDIPGITRNEALKAAGNGVVPQQAAEALRFLLDMPTGRQIADAHEPDDLFELLAVSAP